MNMVLMIPEDISVKDVRSNNWVLKFELTIATIPATNAFIYNQYYRLRSRQQWQGKAVINNSALRVPTLQ